MDIHVVKRGDTLWGIAQQYGVSISQIVGSNQLSNPNNIVIGQSLVIPTGLRQYVVQSGDTLWKIAQTFNVTVREIIEANQLTDPSSLSVGQTLTIPIQQTHVIKQGETLWTIAQTYGTTVQAIIQANQLTNPSLVYTGQTLQIPQKAKQTIDVNAYIYDFGQKGANLIQQRGSYLTSFMPFAYRIQPDGGLSGVDDTASIAAAYNEKVIPILSITNFSSTEAGSKLASTILASKDLQDTLLTNVLATLKQKGYQGLNIDFENVYPTDKDNYNQFLQRAVDRLHPEGYTVSSALAPKTSANQKGLLYEAHDYEAHGRILDFVVLMTYEWGYRLGPPQAVSPIDQMIRVIQYAATVIPPNKIFMGFQLYARDWVTPHVKGQVAETFSPQEAVDRAVKYGATIQYNTTAQSPYYNYTDEKGITHQVWFEDARSAQAKFDLVKQFNLRGVSYWVLGYPFPQNWLLLQDNFTIRKRM